VNQMMKPVSVVAKLVSLLVRSVRRYIGPTIICGVA